MEWNKSAKEVFICKHGTSIQQHYIISSTEFSYSMTYHSVKTLTQGTTDPISSVLHFNLSAACVAERALPTLAGCWHLFLSSEPAAATQHEAGLEEALRFFKSTLKMLIVLNCAVWHWEAVFTLFFCWEVSMTMMTFPLTWHWQTPMQAKSDNLRKIWQKQPRTVELLEYYQTRMSQGSSSRGLSSHVFTDCI